MTRAKELLYLPHSSEPSLYIHEFDMAFLDIDQSPFSTLYKVPLEDYRYQSKVTDLNSKEEMIRQWMLHELHHCFSSPYEFMDIEYPLQYFSRPGFADIVVAGNKFTNEATLKKYYPTCSLVTLAPGNSDYEPIILKPEEVFINGVVVGIMKNKGSISQ